MNNFSARMVSGQPACRILTEEVARFVMRRTALA